MMQPWKRYNVRLEWMQCKPTFVASKLFRILRSILVLVTVKTTVYRLQLRTFRHPNHCCCSPHFLLRSLQLGTVVDMTMCVLQIHVVFSDIQDLL